MRRALALVWLLASLSLAALGQAYTTVTASNVTVDNGSGSAVNPPSGSSLCFLGVNNSGAPITYTPSGGSPVSGTVCQTLNGSGALTGTLQIANPATAAPLGLLYTITVVNGSTTYLTIPTVSLSGTIFSFDSFSLPGTSSANGIGKAHLACASGAQWASTTLPPGQNNQRCNTSGLWDSYPPANYCPAGMAYLVPQQGGTPICQAPTLEGNGAPSGSCFEKSTYLDVVGGGFYACTNGVWSLKSSSSPGVTSIQGAAGAFTFNGGGFGGCVTSGGTTTCTFNGGGSSLPSTHQILAGNGSGGAVATALDDGQTTAGEVTSTEPLNDTSSASFTPAGTDTNTGNSTQTIVPRWMLCPNTPTWSSGNSGCSIDVGKVGPSGSYDGMNASFGWLNMGSPSTNLGFIGISTSVGTTFHAMRWNKAGNIFFPQLLSVPCLGTDSGGTLGAGSCGSSFTLTTSGTSGPATFSGGILNIPQYSSGSVTFAGDLSGSVSSQTVVGLQGKSLPSPALGYLFYDGSAFNWYALPSMVISASTSITLSCGQWIRATSSSAITITVPAPSAATGMCQSVIERGIAAGAITISPAGGTYDGASANLQQGQTMSVLNDGTNWHSTSPIVAGANCTWTASLTGNVLNCSGGGSGSVSDGAGTTTANQIALSTTTAHQIQYSTAIPNGITATTQSPGDNSTKIATDAFVLANSSGPAATPGNAVYNGAINAAFSNAITTNGTLFTNSSTPFWEAAPAYGSIAYVLDNFYYFANAPSTLNPQTVLAFMNNMVGAVSGGNFPISLNPNGTANTFYSGCQSDHTTPTGDGAFVMPQMAKLYWNLTGSTAWFTTNAATLKTALLAVPLNGSTHLVTVASAHPWVTWGFQDGIVKTGDDLWGSLLMWKAAGDMAFLYTEIGDSTDATTFSTIASNIASSLGTGSALWDGTDGMFLAATGQNNQIDVFGSAYAAFLGVISGPQQTAISTYLVSHYGSLVSNGFVHQSPSNWGTSSGGNQCGRGTGNYDDGTWAVANKYIYYALKITSPSQAQQLMTDYAGNANPAMEWYGSSANGYSPNIASVAPSVQVATVNYPGSVTLYPTSIVQPPGCGSAQALASFYGSNGTPFTSYLDNCLNGWQAWTPDTTSGSSMSLNGLGQAQQTPGGATNPNAAVINMKTPSSANYSVSGVFTVANNAAYAVEIFARVQGASIGTAYYVICGTNVSNQCQIHKMVSGSDSSLTGAAFTWASGATHTLTLTVSGSSLTFLMDGVSTLTATDSSISSAGFAGFGLLVPTGTGANTLASSFSFQ